VKLTTRARLRVSAREMPSIHDKVAFLSRPEVYPRGTRAVETVQTHMAWVFLTDRRAYKLKKPVAYDGLLDFSTIERRRHACEEELRLNRRLAAGVYVGIVALTLDADGRLALGGQGEVVDWLVEMHRLPAHRMLDRAIEAGTVSDDELHAVGRLLGNFFARATRVPMKPQEYRARLRAIIDRTHDELVDPVYALPRATIDRLHGVLAAIIESEKEMFDARVRDQRIVEGHGDLRPEHVHVGPNPLVIDCIEFNRELRVADSACEIAFLVLECERLGALRAGQLVFAAYCEASGDAPPARLMRFYSDFHAFVRALVAIRHLKDDEVRDPGKWPLKTQGYLALADRIRPVP
jgi:aminoglycoside phosphotransferase family enzyme